MQTPLTLSPSVQFETHQILPNSTFQPFKLPCALKRNQRLQLGFKTFFSFLFSINVNFVWLKEDGIGGGIRPFSFCCKCPLCGHAGTFDGKLEDLQHRPILGGDSWPLQGLLHGMCLSNEGNEGVLVFLFMVKHMDRGTAWLTSSHLTDLVLNWSFYSFKFSPISQCSWIKATLLAGSKYPFFIVSQWSLQSNFPNEIKSKFINWETKIKTERKKPLNSSRKKSTV